jgi:hypothetical protein
MPAGYVRVWLSTEEAIAHVIRAAKCSQEEAREALAQAIHDEELRSRFAENRVTELFHGARIDLKTLLEASVRDPIPSGELAARMLLPKRRPAVEINRKNLERLWPSPRASELTQAAAAARDGGQHGSSTTSQEAGNVISSRTGLPGRPSSWHLIEVECRRRYQAGERHDKKAEWARQLRAWIVSQHPGMLPPTGKTIANRLTELLRELRSNSKS